MNQNAVCAPAAGSRNTQKKRFTLKMRTREALTGYLFISVNLIGTLIFVVLPLFMTVVLSFSEWDYTKGLAGMEFVGLEHYARMVSDPKISTSLWNNPANSCNHRAGALARVPAEQNRVLQKISANSIFYSIYHFLGFRIHRIQSAVQSRRRPRKQPFDGAGNLESSRMVHGHSLVNDEHRHPDGMAYCGILYGHPAGRAPEHQHRAV